MTATIALPPTIVAKPRRGEACNGCGLCCTMEPCGIAREFIDAAMIAPCVALERHEGRHVCGMMRRPSHYMGLPNDWADEIVGGMIAQALGAGRGCDADDLEPSPSPAVPASREGEV